MLFVLVQWMMPVLFLIAFLVFVVGVVLFFKLISSKKALVVAEAPKEKPEESVLKTSAIEKSKEEPEEKEPEKTEKKINADVDKPKATITKKPSKQGNKTFLIIVIVLILLAAILAGGGYLVYKKLTKTVGSLSSTTSTPLPDGEFKKVLKSAKAEIESDSSKSVSKVITAAGGVLQTEGSDGTLYTLTVPLDAIILPSTVTMTPLTNVPISGYKNKVVGGVQLGGQFSFIRPAYLTIQPNQQKPQPKQGYNYCAPGSRGYNPEMCAGLAGIPFGLGVAPGRVVAFSSMTDDLVVLQPTIPTGMQNTYNAQVFSVGNYFADNATKIDLEKLAQTTFDEASDFTNRTEVLMHLAALGGNLEPYKSEIKRFARQKRDYPREMLKAAIIALAVGDKETATERINDYSEQIDKRSKKIRSAFIPTNRYAALVRQVKYNALKKHRFAKLENNPNIAYAADSVKLALEDYVPNGNGGEENYDWPIPDYEGDNGTDYGPGWTPRSWQDIWNELFPPSTVPPDLRDWSDIAAEAAEKKKADDELEKNSRDEINNPNNTACEKAQAIRTLIALGRFTGNDYLDYSKYVSECAKKCTTMSECEDMGDMGDKWGNSEISNAARTSISQLLAKSSQCNLAKKEGLADYGKNTCESDGSGSDLPEAPPAPSGPASLDL